MTTENATAANDILPHRLLSDLPAKTELSGTYRVQRMEARPRQDGAQFWKLILTDRSGELTCYAWPERCPLATDYASNQLVQVRLATRELNCEIVADILELTPIATPPTGKTIDLLPASVCPIPGLVQRFAALIHGISCPGLRGFVEAVLADDSVVLPFLANPASGQYHHIESGGLLRHSVEAAEAVRRHPLPAADMDIAVIAALFHDIGKAWTFNRDGTKTLMGRLVDHDHLVLEICAEGLRALAQANHAAACMLRHIWTASTNPNYGIPIQSYLVQAVRTADRLTAELDKQVLAFANAAVDCDTARVGREMRFRLIQPIQPAAA